jgi:hypothetical protein
MVARAGFEPACFCVQNRRDALSAQAVRAVARDPTISQAPLPRDGCGGEIRTRALRLPTPTRLTRLLHSAIELFKCQRTGTGERIRTANLSLRRRPLSPIELRRRDRNWCGRGDSNADSRFRKPKPYPLDDGHIWGDGSELNARGQLHRLPPKPLGHRHAIWWNARESNSRRSVAGRLLFH